MDDDLEPVRKILAKSDVPVSTTLILDKKGHVVRPLPITPTLIPDCQKILEAIVKVRACEKYKNIYVNLDQTPLE